MKLFVRTTLMIGGATALAGVGIGAYFYLNKDKQERVVYDFSNAAESKLTFENNQVGYAIAPDTMKYFSQMIERQQFSGSEETMLNKVVIGRTTDSKNNGEYTSGVITINAKVIKERHNYKNHFDFAYHLYQIYAHEYLHFVANTYLKGLSAKTLSVPVTTFLSEFKASLHYDKKTSKYSGQKIKNGFKSIGSLYDAKDLYDFSNGATSDLKDSSFTNIGTRLHPKFIIQKDGYKYVMAPLNPVFVVDKNHVITKNSIQYIFSIDELFARKYMLINTTYQSTLNNNKDTMEGFRPDGFVNYHTNKGKVTSTSPYLEDVFNFRRSLNSTGGVYLQDDPFAAKVRLEKLYARIIGNTKNQIMNVKTYNSKEAISGNATLVTTDGRIEPEASPYKYIGFKATKTTAPQFYPITIKRKVQVMGDGTFITRDIFYTNRELPAGTGSKHLFLYRTNDGTDLKPQELTVHSKFV